MPLTRIEADNFTVFEHIGIPFNKGLNVLVGENGMGKSKAGVRGYVTKENKETITNVIMNPVFFYV